jgi:hypothetical protein
MKTFKQFMEGAMDGNIFKGKLKPMMNPDGEYPKDLPFIRDKNIKRREKRAFDVSFPMNGKNGEK